MWLAKATRLGWPGLLLSAGEIRALQITAELEERMLRYSSTSVPMALMKLQGLPEGSQGVFFVDSGCWTCNVMLAAHCIGSATQESVNVGSCFLKDVFNVTGRSDML